jgi:prepilin-type processing-associated H-X9-DG protein
MYTNDYSSYLPPSYWEGWTSAAYNVLDPYVGKKLWTCPSGPASERWMVTSTGVNYGWNDCSGNSSVLAAYGYRDGGWKRLSQLKNCSQLLLCVDMYNCAAVGGSIPGYGSSSYWNFSVKRSGGIDPRHNLGINVLWVDGHVRWVRQISKDQRYWPVE